MDEIYSGWEVQAKMNVATDRYHCWKIPHFLEISPRRHCIPPVGTILSHPASSIARSMFRIAVHHKLRTFQINLINEEKQSPIQDAHKQFSFIIPSHTPILPRLLIPAEMWTLVGCLCLCKDTVLPARESPVTLHLDCTLISPSSKESLRCSWAA